MKGYVYASVRAANIESRVLVSVIEGETNSDIERVYSKRFDTDTYGLTYTPAFGSAYGIAYNENAEMIVIE